MHPTSRFFSVRRPLRAAALLALLLLLGLVGLRPPPAALAACDLTGTAAGNTDALNAAITAYNGLETPCDFLIEITADILLDEDLIEIINDNPDVSLTINGNGHTLDADGAYEAIRIHTTDVTINDLTILGGVNHGIYASDGTLRVNRGRIEGNTQHGISTYNGDIVVRDTLVMDNLNNGLVIDGPDYILHLINTTITGNTVNGALLTWGESHLTHVTITENGGVGLWLYHGTGTVHNTIVADNVGDDCRQQEGDTAEFQHTLVEVNDVGNPCGVENGVAGNIVGDDPLLTPLADHGGPTPTTLPAKDSPARDTGDNDLSDDEGGNWLTTDQRGDIAYPRKLFSTVDMGAAESSCSPITTVGNNAELRAAINCFNATETGEPYVISLDNSITLDADLPEFTNDTPGITLDIVGNGYTLDGNRRYNGLRFNNVPKVEISDIVLANSAEHAVAGHETELRVMDSIIMDAMSNGIYTYNTDLVVLDTAIINNKWRGVHSTSNTLTTYATLINTTIAGNGVELKWGITVENANTVRLAHVTLADNNGGLFIKDVSGLFVENSILAGNGPDCRKEGGAPAHIVKYSLVQVNDPDSPCDGLHEPGAENIVGDDPMLMPLGYHGSPTLIMPPYEAGGDDSPVIDAGNNDLSIDTNHDPIQFDQRGPGYDRKLNGTVDMGAVEGAVAVTCPTFPVTVNDEAGLNNAIFCYGLITTPGDSVITLGDHIALTESTYPIDNPNSGVALTIDGQGYAIDGQGFTGVRPLTIDSMTTVTLEGVAVGRGNVPGRGGAIFNEGNLTLDLVNVAHSVAGEGGGGIFNTFGGVVTIIDSQVAANAGGYGGGIVNEGDMTITDTIVVQNGTLVEVWARGGGIVNEGDLTLVRSYIESNTASAEEIAYGGGIYNEARLLVRDTTLSYNTAESPEDAVGGGIYSLADPLDVIHDGFAAELLIINSTISTNAVVAGSDAAGGGLFAGDGLCCEPLPDAAGVMIRNTTIAGNSVAGSDLLYGSGAYFVAFNPPGLSANVFNSIVADNLLNGAAGGDCQAADLGFMEFVSFYSLYSYADEHACGLATGYPGANGNWVGVVAHLGGLAYNGGDTPTHMPGPGSPAIDNGNNNSARDESGNPLEADQRGYEPRIVNGTVDIGAVEVGAEEPAGDAALYMTAAASGKASGGFPFDNSDILQWDGTTWTTYFDGSVALNAPKKSRHNINAFWIGDDEIIMAFLQNARVVPGITPTVDGTDLVRWDGSAFSLWFDGSDVELNIKGRERIDGLHVLPGDEAPVIFESGTCLYYLLISTQGPGMVTDYDGGKLKFGGEDVLGFCATGLGETTTGYWHMWLDGSDEGVKKNAIDSISLSADRETFYVTTRAKFKLDAANGNHSSVYAYDRNTGNFSGPLFVANQNGLPKKVNGLQMD